ncbi:MAG: MarR family transcriptional regulator [Clostridiales bacterium]|nr:MarR family transcriptional regulator [Clostridiales bacterium]
MEQQVRIADYADEKKELSLMQQICSTLLSFAKKLEKQDGRKNRGLSLRQFLILLTVRHTPPGEASMVRIARRLGTTKQNINQMIPVLVKNGYLTRSPYGKNRKGTFLQVTDSGMNAVKEYAETGTAHMVAIFNSFSTEEMETLLHLLQKLHRYDGEDYDGFENDILRLFEREYADTLYAILESYNVGKTLLPAEAEEVSG